MACCRAAFTFTLHQEWEKILVSSPKDLGIRNFFVNFTCVSLRRPDCGTMISEGRQYIMHVAVATII